MNWNKFFWGKHPDGRRKAGFGVIALFTLVPLVIVIFVLRGEREGRDQIIGKGVQIEGVDRAVQSVERVEDSHTDTGMKSDRGIGGVSDLSSNVQQEKERQKAEDKAPVVANALDAATAEALKEPEKERPILMNDSALPGSEPSVGGSSNESTVWNPLAPVTNAGRPGDDGATGSYSNSIQNAIVYRRQKKTTETPAPPEAPAAPKYEVGTFLPRGLYIDLYLLDTVRTDNDQPLITFAVARDVKLHGKVFLPFGTRILGSTNGAPDKGQRIAFEVNSVQFPDGTEIPIAGVIKGLDGATGLPAYYIPPPVWTQFSSYVADFVGGYLDLLQAHQQNNLAIRVGSVDVGYTPQTFDPKMEALAATSEVIKNFAQKQMDELQARNAPYLITPPGTVARLQLLAPLSIKDRGVGVVQTPAKAPDTPSIPGLPDLSKILPSGAQGKALQQAIAAASAGATR